MNKGRGLSKFILVKEHASSDKKKNSKEMIICTKTETDIDLRKYGSVSGFGGNG